MAALAESKRLAFRGETRKELFFAILPVFARIGLCLAIFATPIASTQFVCRNVPKPLGGIFGGKCRDEDEDAEDAYVS